VRQGLRRRHRQVLASCKVSSKSRYAFVQREASFKGGDEDDISQRTHNDGDRRWDRRPSWVKESVAYCLGCRGSSESEMNEWIVWGSKIDEM
jgi:hypothetical protein